MYKLFTATLASRRSQKGNLLAEGSVSEIVEFVNSVGDGYRITEVNADDIGEDATYEVAPEDWTEEAPFIVETPTDQYGGMKSEEEALREYVSHDESVTLEWVK